MIHEILPVGVLQCNCSVFGDEETRDALVVDPGDDIDDVLAVVGFHPTQRSVHQESRQEATAVGRQHREQANLVNGVCAGKREIVTGKIFID